MPHRRLLSVTRNTRWSRGNTPRPLAGQPIVVTGAGSGIGRALAKRFSRHGCPVAVCDLDPDGLELTARTLTGRVLNRIVDVADRNAMQAFAAEVHDWAPAPIGAVVNNAGVALISTVAHGRTPDEEWLRRINVDGVVNGTRAFLPLLTEADSGAIVNVSSIFGLIGVPTQSAYCASKFAVRGFTESLRHELRGSNVRAVTVLPGGISTNIAQHARWGAPQPRENGDHAALVARFEQLAMTSADQAARAIHRGVDQGRARILIGADARAIDALARITPAHYYDVLEFGQRLVSLRQPSPRNSVGARVSAPPVTSAPTGG